MVPDTGEIVNDQAQYKWLYASPQQAGFKSQNFLEVCVVYFSIL